ncbi:MAG TPA: hypothetical protein DD670_20710 [Planctomycetaceae bacterium]|nr:hypothetical protein [Planctomycetaceae bacterium]
MTSLARRIYEWLHRHFIWCLLVVYALGALTPPLEEGSIGHAITALGGRWPLRLLLAVILFNAGLGTDPRQFGHTRHNWRLLVAGWAVGLILPMALVMAAMPVLALAGAPRDYFVLLLGFAVVAAMPTAGASAAWAQNAEANLALSLGLVLLSTLASPLCSAAALGLVGLLMAGDTVGRIGRIEPDMAAWFLALWVMVPALVGLTTRRCLGSARVDRMKSWLKLINLASLLLLYYLNAVLTLPNALAFHSASVFGAAAIGAVGLAAAVFLGGELLARGLRVGRPERVSFLFGLALKNNGAAMVLVSTVLAAQELALLSIIAYSLAQNIGAALIDRYVVGESS